MRKKNNPAGATPLERSQHNRKLWFKREDQNPTGSHKDRAADYQLSLAVQDNNRAVVISSSGNAAIATSYFADQHGVPAVVFVHPDTDPQKLAAINGKTTFVVVTKRAINGAKYLAKQLKIPNLRPSTNDDAIVGYRSLGEELLDELPEQVDAIVMFATSGASAVAVADVLKERNSRVQLHVVQGEGSSAIVAPQQTITEHSAHHAAAGRLGVRRSRRAKQVQKAIANTGGKGHVATRAQVENVKREYSTELADLSDESAANIAVAEELTASGLSVCAVISGAPQPVSGFKPEHIFADDEYEAFQRVQKLLR